MAQMKSEVPAENVISTKLLFNFPTVTKQTYTQSRKTAQFKKHKQIPKQNDTVLISLRSLTRSQLERNSTYRRYLIRNICILKYLR